VEKLIRRVWRY